MKRLLDINASKLLSLLLFISLTTATFAQEEYSESDPGDDENTNTASYKLGNGLQFSFNEGNYNFKLSGFIQPSYFLETQDGLNDINQFNSKRSFLQFEGNALKEKVSFFVQLDYSLSSPLLDAWLAYEPFEQLKISVGQKQTFVNNREMLIREDRLQFNDRSFLSQNLSQTGREFGLFLESKFTIGNKFGIAPKAAITSGDGRNSFGNDSRDTDLGGFKIGGRLDIYPLGFFKPGNDLTTADLGREETLKAVIGVAGSQNNGASNTVGEGHGDFFLYDINGANSLPDYEQFYADLLMKYKGFSFLAEYASTAASDIDLVFIDENATQILAPQQISEYLALGETYNLQLGYVTKNGYSFDLRYETGTPEFENNPISILGEYNATTFGFTKYFLKNGLKFQASYSVINPLVGENINQFQVLFQIAL